MPEGFPWDVAPAALPGTQVKVSARLIDGRYVVGLTPQERLEHYRLCQDLIEQLLVYHQRHQQDDPPLGVDELLRRFEHTAISKRWSVTAIELRWMSQRVRAILSPPELGSERQT